MAVLYYLQGPRNNFEIGGGGGKAQDTFSYQLFIILKILEGHVLPLAPPVYFSAQFFWSAQPLKTSAISLSR